MSRLRKTAATKNRLRIIQVRIEPAEYRRAVAMAKRADLSLAAFVRAAIVTHARVEAELAAQLAAERAAAERRLVDEARQATPGSFADAPAAVAAPVAANDETGAAA